MTKEELKQKIDDLDNEVINLYNYQEALKILMNSEYGALGSNHFRYYDIKLASAVTLSGQWVIKHIENYLMNHPLQKKYKWNVLYSDTDSIYVSIEYLVSKFQEKIKDKQKLLDTIDKFSKEIIEKIIIKGYNKLKIYCNANENRMIMKREKIMQKCVHPNTIIDGFELTIEEIYNLIETEEIIFNDCFLKQCNFDITSLNENVLENENDILYAISKKKYNGYMYKFQIDDKFIEVTAEHKLPIIVNNKIIWKQAKDIKETDILFMNRN